MEKITKEKEISTIDTLESSGAVPTAAILSKLPKDHEIFNTQHFRILREMVATTAGIKNDVPMKRIMQIIIGLVDDFKKSIIFNNRSITNASKEIKKLRTIDPIAYKDKIEHYEKVKDESTVGNVSLRAQAKQAEDILCAINTQNTISERQAGYIDKLKQTSRIRSAILKIGNDKEKLDWIVREYINSPEELKNYIIKYNTESQLSVISEDFATTLREQILFFKSKIGVIKEYIKVADPEIYERISDLDIEELDSYHKAISFMRDFKKFTLNVTNTEALLKVDGISTELNECMDVVLGIMSMMNKLGIDSSTKEGMAMAKQMMELSIAEDITQLNLAYEISGVVAISLFGYTIKDIDTEEVNKLKTLLLMAVFSLMDVKSGVTVINLVARFS